MNSMFNKLLKRVTAQQAVKRSSWKEINKSIRSGANSPIDKHRKMVATWNSWNLKQKHIAIKKFKSDVGNNKTLAEYFAQLERTVNRITTKKALGKILTTTEQKFLDEYIDLFVFEENFFNAVNSSWIISASYQSIGKVMSVRMVRGTADYLFHNVPKWVWVHLTTLPSHAGKWWWDKWIWKYSSNSAKWNKI